MHGRSRRRLVAYGVAVLAPAVTLLVRWPLSAVVGDRVLYTAFFPVVLIAAYLGGFGPGFLATVLSVLAATYFLVEPLYSLEIISVPDAVAVALFVLVGTIISGLGESLHRARRRIVAVERRRAEEAAARDRGTLPATGGEHPRDLLDHRPPGRSGDLRQPRLRRGLGANAPELLRTTGFLAREHPSGGSGRGDRAPGATGRGELWVREYRVVRPDGSVRWIRGRVFPIKDQAGRLWRIAGLAEDITERKEAEHARARPSSGWSSPFAVQTSAFGSWRCPTACSSTAGRITSTAGSRWATRLRVPDHARGLDGMLSPRRPRAVGAAGPGEPCRARPRS